MAENFVNFHCVKITPPRVIFEVCPHKTTYQAKIAFQNVGKTKVSIRILQPKPNENFQIESILTGQNLSPGLKIVRTIKAKWFKDCPRECLVPVYVNDHKYDYLIVLKKPPATVTITPNNLDFGLLNTGTLHVSQMVMIKNNSEKDYMFYVDLHQCGDDIIVEPTKGRIKSKATYEVLVRVITFKELDLECTMFIKCAYQITPVSVKAKVIFPKLEVFHPNATENFTILEFPPTYYGLTSNLNLFVRNYSAIGYMFSTIGEISNRYVKLEDIKKDSINFKFFNVHPSNGLLQGDETRLFKFSFSPVELDLTTKNIPYFFCTILMRRFKCALIGMEKLSSVGYNNSIAFDFSCGRSSPTDLSGRTSELGMAESLVSLHAFPDDKAYHFYNLEVQENDFARIHLYGTGEVPAVQIIPDEICIRDMHLQKRERRIIELRNISKFLPIIFRYKKSPHINLESETFHLKPLESLQVSVYIDSSQIGKVSTELNFDLMYYDEPRVEGECRVIGRVKVDVQFNVLSVTAHPKPQLNMGLKPNYIREVGKHCHGIKFNSKLKKGKCITVHNLLQIDRNCQDLVAFPNDTQTSVKPWRSLKTCRTIFTRQERYVAPVNSLYELRLLESLKKKQEKDYYATYTRQQLTRPKPVVSACEEYDVTNSEKVLCGDVRMLKLSSVRYEKPKKGMYFLPLTPQEMDNVVIIPPVIKTSKMACHNCYNFQVRIKNDNAVPIRVIISSDKERNIIYTSGNRHMVNKHQEVVLDLCYRAQYVGFYVSHVYFIINESSVLSVPILAEVVSLQLLLNSQDIILDNQHTHKFIEIENILNVEIPFTWMLLFPNFSIEPISGTVQPNRKIVCKVSYHFEVEGPNETMAKLHTSTQNVQTVKIKVKVAGNKLVALTKDVIFGSIPLNEEVLQILIIKNSEVVYGKFCVSEQDIPHGLSVVPLDGVIDPLGQYNIYVTAKFLNCIRFNYTLKIDTFQGGILEVPVQGEVVYPDIIINPKIIHIEKIPASTTTCANFTVKNNSAAQAKIRFELEEYEEFSIRKSSHPWADNIVDTLTLNSQTTESLFIHFSPHGASSWQFYLPIVINDILGPPIFNDVVSTKIQYYLVDSLENCIEHSRTPMYIPCVRIHTLVTPPKVEISKNNLTFSTYPQKRNKSIKILISNPQQVEEDICIRTERLRHPLYLEFEDNIGVCTFHHNAVSVHLKPSDKVFCIVSFKPNSHEFGRYRVLLPIYVRSDLSSDFHNAITLTATYNKPEITISYLDKAYTAKSGSAFAGKYIFYYEPVALSFEKRCYKLHLRCFHHLPDCQLTMDMNCSSSLEHKSTRWEPLMETKTVESDGNYTVEVALYFHFTHFCEFRRFCEIKCSCGGHWWQQHEGIAENSVLTAYANIENMFKVVVKHLPAFPFYPLYPADSHIHSKFAEEVLASVQCWLATQVCFGTWSYTLSESVSLPIYQPVSSVHLKRQTKLSTIPMLHIIANLMGAEVLTALPKEYPTDVVARVKWLHNVYANVIRLVRQEGAALITLRPENLFCYADFIIYCKHILDYNQTPLPFSASITDYNIFMRLSKLCWMDFILQLYKCLYLWRLTEKYSECVKTGKLKNTPLSNYFSIEHVPIQPTLYSESESLIMNWLQYHYNENRNNVWEGVTLEQKSVDLYNDSLCNGVIFGVVLATYCPYLITFLKDMYPTPENNEQSYHNVARLIQCLEKVMYSFTTTTGQIITGNSIRLLMFSVYLFDILPHMFPVDTITIKTGLSTKTSYNVELQNQNNFIIAYRVIFIGDDTSSFTTALNFFEIGPKKKTILNIIYFAKFAKQVNCSLILSGECSGYRYATNKCISLIGIPDIHYVTTTIHCEHEIYKLQNVKFLIQSPYEVKTKYRLQQVYDELHEPKELENVVYHENKGRITCGRCTPLNKTFEADENGIVTLEVAIMVGDFAIKIISSTKDSTQTDTILVTLPNVILHIKERARKLFIEIPSKNYQLLRALKAWLVAMCDPKEADLWNRIVDTPAGGNVLEYMFTMNTTRSNVISPVSCKGVKYRVIGTANCDVTFPEIIVFEDECSEFPTIVPVILKNSTPKNFSFILESIHLLKRRYYTVTFVYDQQ